MKIQQNAYTQNLTENEFVAVNPAGTPIGRAANREALEQAHPDGSATILTAAEVNAAEPTLAEAVVATLEGPFAAVVAQGVKDLDGNEPLDAAPANVAPVEPVKEKSAKDPFDHDNSGSAGGSKKGDESTAHKGAEAKKAAAHAKK